jgi:hypothetical protein
VKRASNFANETIGKSNEDEDDGEDDDDGDRRHRLG